VRILNTYISQGSDAHEEYGGLVGSLMILLLQIFSVIPIENF